MVCRIIKNNKWDGSHQLKSGTWKLGGNQRLGCSQENAKYRIKPTPAAAPNSSQNTITVPPTSSTHQPPPMFQEPNPVYPKDTAQKIIKPHNKLKPQIPTSNTNHSIRLSIITKVQPKYQPRIAAPNTTHKYKSLLPSIRISSQCGQISATEKSLYLDILK